MWRKIFFALCVALIILQILDIAVHVATDQVEVVRIISSVAIILWAVAILGQTLASVQIPSRALMALCVVVLLINLVLNIVFLVQEGPMNEGRPRIPLFLFVLITLGLGACGGGVHMKPEVAAGSENKFKETASPQTVGANP